LSTLFGEHTFFIEDHGFEHRPASNTGGTHWRCAALAHRSGFSGAAYVLGSLIAVTAGGYLAVWAPTDTLRLVLAAILTVSAVKLWSKSGTQSA
jgi:uncharacterized membrane protein YfcA